MGVRAEDLDRLIGQEVRERRILAGLTQMEFAELIGITYQQVQKYERGSNRISAGRLWRISRALDCAIGDLFAQVEQQASGKPDTAAMRPHLMVKTARQLTQLAPCHQEAVQRLIRALTEDDAKDPGDGADLAYDQSERHYPGLSEDRS